MAIRRRIMRLYRAKFVQILIEPLEFLLSAAVKASQSSASRLEETFVRHKKNRQTCVITKDNSAISAAGSSNRDLLLATVIKTHHLELAVSQHSSNLFEIGYIW